MKSAETPLKTIRTLLTSTPVNAVVSVSPEVPSPKGVTALSVHREAPYLNMVPPCAVLMASCHGLGGDGEGGGGDGGEGDGGGQRIMLGESAMSLVTSGEMPVPTATGKPKVQD